MKPIYGLVVLILLVGGIFFLVSGNDDATDESDSNSSVTEEAAELPAQPTADEDEPTVDSYSTAQVAEHSSEEDCWTIISGKVYDITSYIPRHPGGSTILAACGTDGTSLFTQRTTADGETVGSGTPHSSNANSALADFEIGVLDAQ